jgi:hypothetical protein
MKIRISDQTLRMRLTKDEALSLQRGAHVVTSLQLNFIDVFEIELHSWNLSIGEVHFEKNKLKASIPHSAAKQLSHENGYVYRCEQQASQASALILEVEIDLQKVKQA